MKIGSLVLFHLDRARNRGTGEDSLSLGNAEVVVPVGVLFSLA